MIFTDGSAIFRTTAPTPVVMTASLITTGTGNKTKVSGITVTFNTAINPALAQNVKLYQVKIGTKGKKFIKIKSATYNAATNSVSLLFKGKAQKINKKGYTVLIAASLGIVKSENGTNLLNNGRHRSRFSSRRPRPEAGKSVVSVRQLLPVAPGSRRDSGARATAEYSPPGSILGKPNRENGP